jgi:hypothetical protein
MPPCDDPKPGNLRAKAARRVFVITAVLFFVFTLFFVDHNMIVDQGDRYLVKHRATKIEKLIGSVAFAVVGSSLSTGLYIAIDFAEQWFRGKD